MEVKNVLDRMESASKPGKISKRNKSIKAIVSLFVFFFLIIIPSLSNFRTLNKYGNTLEKSSVILHQETASHDQKFAYAFLVAGCNPPSLGYKGYIYNIAIAKHMLNQYNSTADVVAMIRMHVDTNYTTLPPEDEEILTKSGVKVKYLPKPLTDNFHTAMMDKFRILELTEYDRVIYLDGDIMPLNNLDYIFEKSVGPNATLEENFVVATRLEPASGGIFMLKPSKEDYKEIKEIILNREKQGYHFNQTTGFGHQIISPDYWESTSKNGTEWEFYGAFTDQGLLYHWTKYVKKKVTIVITDSVKTYNTNENGDVQMIRQQSGFDVFRNTTSDGHHLASRFGGRRKRPYKDYSHFVEKFKPWFHRTAKNPPKDIENMNLAKTYVELWYHVLRKITKENNFNIDPENLNVGRPILGLFPTNAMVMNANDQRLENEKSRL